jgi:protein-S-isoprenylcysteine O-methyltransferase
VAIELISRIPTLRQRVSRTFDPTQLVVSISLVIGFVLAFRAAEHRLWVFGGGWPSIAVGLGIAASGVALRTWSIVTLGRFFTYDVTIQPEHRVVTAGPYRWLRHPSYTGGLVGLLGLGVALGSAAAVLALVVVPLIGVLIRIRHEERTLRTALGAEYDAYAAHTPRLIPRIW